MSMRDGAGASDLYRTVASPLLTVSRMRDWPASHLLTRPKSKRDQLYNVLFESSTEYHSTEEAYDGNPWQVSVVHEFAS